MDDADDIAAVLRYRVASAASRRTGTSRARPAPRLIVGLIPEASGPMTGEMRRALGERRQLIEQRATALAETAVGAHEPWAEPLGEPPRDPRRRQAWMR